VTQLALDVTLAKTKHTDTTAYIVAIISHPHFWPYHNDLPIVDNNPTVVRRIFMDYRPKLGQTSTSQASVVLTFQYRRLSPLPPHSAV
jgi:hypothetical protein